MTPIKDHKMHRASASKGFSDRLLPERSTTMKQLRTLPLLLASPLASLPAWAHEGHGMPGFAHWHASDVLGFVAVIGAIAAVIWFKGGK